MIAVLILCCCALFAFGIWHGNRMFELGEEHGRKLEAMDARHARERLLLEAHREVTLGAIKGVQDRRLVRRWVADAFRRPGDR